MKLTLLSLSFALTTLTLSAENLQETLDARKADFEEKASKEKIDEYNKGIAAVIKSGLIEKALNVGDRAPDFTLKNAVGDEVTLSKLLANGPVVLTWYRGSWCPYCNLTLQSYQANLDKLTAAGAQLVAISPEKPDQSLPTQEEYDLEFEVLSDPNNQVAQEFGIVFTMTSWVEDAMREFADLKKYNGENYDDTTLPLSATYIIQPDHTISYAFLDAEYRNRATPEQVLISLGKSSQKD